LGGHIIEWESGKSIHKATDGRPHTHCSAFAASAAKHFGIYLLRPVGNDDPPGVRGRPESANAQFDWLHGEQARQFGWQEVQGPVSAQHKANQGHLVVAVYKESDPNITGHIAVVRPSTRSERSLEHDGPEVIQAGTDNHRATTVREGFKHHRHAWKHVHNVRFFYNTRSLDFHDKQAASEE
jgi:hypothetical protein